MTIASTATRLMVMKLLMSLVVGGLMVPLVAAPASAAPTASCGQVTPAALADYFNTAVPDKLARDKVPGAVVSVVAGGETVFAQGYGLSDVERGTPMSATDSLVRIASITKLFTWTAVMQQVEAGRLDLDADVNTYLDVKVPDTFPAPVTLRNLMDHTAGFENVVVGTGARTASDVPPLHDYLAANMPRRIYPPGVITAYSNYGAGLAGYIVSRVSGEPYDQYVQRHLLDPLDMRHSTATEPVPAALASDLARSYNTDDGAAETVPFTFDRMPPDGSISTTATDMARFAAAHLGHGPAVLGPATMATMHERSYGVDPQVGGYAHGFRDVTRNGRRVLMHDGGWEGFLSGLILVPDCDLGLFLSINATGGGPAARDLLGGFFDRFVPVVTPTVSSTVDHAAPRAGFYKLTRHNESTVEKILVLLGPSRLSVTSDGGVRFGGKPWTPDGDGRYRSEDGLDRLVFHEGTDGHLYIVTNNTAYQLMSYWETPMVNLVVLLVFLVPALTALAVPLVGLWRRLRRRSARPTPEWRVARGLLAGASLLGIVFLVALTFTLIGDTGDFLYGTPLSFQLLLALPVLTLVAALAAAGLTVRSWSSAGLAARIHQVVLLVAMVPLTWFLVQWNLLGW